MCFGLSAGHKKHMTTILTNHQTKQKHENYTQTHTHTHTHMHPPTHTQTKTNNNTTRYSPCNNHTKPKQQNLHTSKQHRPTAVKHGCHQPPHKARTTKPTHTQTHNNITTVLTIPIQDSLYGHRGCADNRHLDMLQ